MAKKTPKTKFEVLIGDHWLPINDRLAVKRIAEFGNNIEVVFEKLNNGGIVEINQIKYRRSVTNG